MRSHGSKFLLISMLTFAVGVGMVMIWQFFTHLEKLEPTPSNPEPVPQIVQNNEEISQNQPLEPDICEEIKKNPKYPFQKPSQLMMVSGGVLNQRVCKPLPYRQIDPNARDYTKEYVVVQVTVDENGFVRSSSVVTPQNKFARRFEKIAKGLRIRPSVISNGIHLRCTGVLIFYSKENYSGR